MVKRKTYSLEEKKQILHVVHLSSVKDASEKFDVKQSTIRTWLSKEKQVTDSQEEVKNDVDVEFDSNLARIYLSKKSNAKHPFLLSLKRLSVLLKESKCFYTGIKLNNDTLSIERINPYVGYTDDNTVLADTTVNSEKSSLDHFMHSKSISKEVKIFLLKKMVKELENWEGDTPSTEKQEIKALLINLSRDPDTLDVDRSRILHIVLQEMSGHSVKGSFSKSVRAQSEAMKSKLEGKDLDLFKQLVYKHRDSIVRGMYK